MLIMTALAVALAAPPAERHVPDFAHVRTANATLQATIDAARAQSPTFAALLDRLDRTDVVVYLEFASRPLPRGQRGHLHFVTAVGNHRFLRVRLPTQLSRLELMASIAHELWHAIEIGEDRDVRCEHTMRQLYLRIGEERDRNEFETKKAILAGQAVRAEILAP